MPGLWVPVFILALLFANPRPASADITELHHSVYLGGLYLGSIETRIEEGQRHYKIEASAKTSKTFDWAFRWIISGNSEGLIGADKLRPLQHSYESIWNKSVRTVTLDYQKSGKVETKTTGKPWNPSARRTPVDPASLSGSVDPMTAMLIVSDRLDKGKGCSTEIPIYDGYRRYDVHLKQEAPRRFKPTPYSIFSGMAIGCRLEVQRKGGFTAGREAQKLSEEEPVIWAASPAAGARIVPVRMQMNTDFGQLMLHLDQYHEGPIRLTSRTKQ